ncbi:MAG TPA: hypothetical protein VNO14_09990 [Blastocatellia bacterium]|nr:hypothetical protein [Blastocatellia bacterium]
MFRFINRASLLTVLAASGVACVGTPPTVIKNESPTSQPSASQPPARPQSGSVEFKAQEGWVTETPTSSMRAAQYRLPKTEDDPEDASLVVFYFGPGQGGSTQANLERWISQMEQPDGRPSSERAKTENLTVNGMNVSLLDVSGRYTAEMVPGEGTRHNKPNYRMRAAVIETPAGPYFVKLVGPQKTVARWDESFIAFVKSFNVK